MTVKTLEELTKHLPPDDNSGTAACEVCEAHDRIMSVVHDDEAYLCPHCEAPMVDFQMDVVTAEFCSVSDHNGGNPDQKLRKRLVLNCRKCEKPIQIVLQPIMYNANHDIHYTGYNTYIPIQNISDEVEKELKEILKPTVQQYHDRLLDGDLSLSPWNLNLWISRDIENVIIKTVNKLMERIPHGSN